ncbi:MAG: cyclic nucleotide-binding domain-containing protein [Polyangiaceae bacterium]|nr:cyclic nucleotide-binding domain-containing protein [Polyangiaceae bacterium]
MPRVAKSETVVPKLLSPSEQSALTDELHELIHEMFGVSRDDVLHGVVAAKSDLTKLLVHRNDAGKAVGYFAIHFFDKDLGGVPSTVVRAGVGMLRDYRGQNNNLSWALRVLTEHALANRRKRFYGLGTMVHPTSYMQVDRYVDTYWPRPGEAVPSDVLEFMVQLADEFRMPLVDPSRPLVRSSSYRTLQTDAERDYWRRSENPAARFFVSMIPDYGDGRGMLTLFPITASMLGGTAAKYARDKAKRAVEGALATVQRLPIGARLLRPSAVKKRLRAVSLFSALEDVSLAKIAERAEIVSLPGGRTLFRAGDEGDDMYLVARGAVSVIRDGEADEMIDQLGAGSLFGEVAMLADRRRSASIKTAIPSTLVRIPGAALRSLMAERPEIGDAIWASFSARVFDDHLRAGPGRVPTIDRSARQAWIARGRHADVSSGMTVATEGDAFLLVLRGAVSIERAGTVIRAQAPLVLESDPSARVTAVSPARVVHVPLLKAAPGTAA